jgi:hypothetical protein
MAITGKTHKTLETALADPAAAREITGALNDFAKRLEKLEKEVFPSGRPAPTPPLEPAKPAPTEPPPAPAK